VKPTAHRGPEIRGSAGAASTIETPERPSDPSIIQDGVQEDQSAGRSQHTLHLAERRVQLVIGQMVRDIDAHDDIDRRGLKRHADGVT